MTIPQISITRNIEWLLPVAILVVFAALKMSHLSTPFFWDETGVYGRISFHLADTGLSLHPASVDQWISRGHPLLYPFVIASFCKLFGTTTFVAHFANLVISVALLITIFVHTRKIFSFRAGLFSMVYLMVQPIFFTQSAMVLPEIALGLCLWWMTWAFYKHSLWLYVLFGSFAVLIKETAIVWLLALAFYDFLSHKPRFYIGSIRWLLPVIPFLIFLVVQKQTWDWYLFPYHSGSISFEVDPTATKFWRYLVFLFWEQGRGIIPVVIIPFSIYAWKARISDWKKILSNPTSFGLIGTFVCLSYLLFSSTTFYLWRYMLPIFPFLAVFVGVSVDKIYHMLKVWWAILITAVLYLLPVSKMSSDHFVYDIDMSYLRSIDATQKTLQYMVDEGIYVRGQFSVNFPLAFAMLDKRFGYLLNGIENSKSSPISDRTHFAVTLTPGSSLKNPDKMELFLIHEEYYHDIKMSVYEVCAPSN
jgi:Dolichyl-phosphate-mannose-protein mannosyltransferase